MKALLLPLFAAFTLAGCTSKVDFEIDNPTDTALTLRIDDKDLSVPARNSAPVSLAAGEHHLHSEKLGDVRFIVYTGGKGGLINPTLGEYVTVREIYVTDADKMQNFGQVGSGAELGGVTFEGPFEQTHDLFIEKSWDFGVHQPFPEQQIVTHVNSSGGKISTKIFTARDFIAYVEASMDEPGAYLKQQPAGYVAPDFTLEPTPATLPPLDPVFEAHAGPLRDVYARYLKAATAAEQEALRKEAFQAQVAFTKATASLGSGVSVEANRAYNAFVSTRMETMGRSALIVP